MKSLIHIYVYSGIHIGLCVVAMIAFTDQIHPETDLSYWFYTLSFFSTILIYSLHKIIGASKITQDTNSGRIKLFKKYSLILASYSAIISGILIYVVFQLEIQTIRALLLPGALSLLYVIPFARSGTRLRDIHFIKIFIIAFVWAIVTVWIPVILETHLKLEHKLLFCGEKFVFILAITFPFDLRDRAIDQSTGLKTISGLLGQRSVLLLSLLLLLLASGISCCLYYLQLIDLYSLIATLIAYLITGLLIKWIIPKQNDLYFAGVLDATMAFPWIILQVLLIFI